MHAICIWSFTCRQRCQSYQFHHYQLVIVMLTNTLFPLQMSLPHLSYVVHFSPHYLFPTPKPKRRRRGSFKSRLPSSACWASDLSLMRAPPPLPWASKVLFYVIIVIYVTGYPVLLYPGICWVSSSNYTSWVLVRLAVCAPFGWSSFCFWSSPFSFDFFDFVIIFYVNMSCTT